MNISAAELMHLCVAVSVASEWISKRIQTNKICLAEKKAEKYIRRLEAHDPSSTNIDWINCSKVPLILRSFTLNRSVLPIEVDKLKISPTLLYLPSFQRFTYIRYGNTFEMTLKPIKPRICCGMSLMLGDRILILWKLTLGLVKWFNNSVVEKQF